MSEHQSAPDQYASDSLPGKRLKAEREHQGLSRDEVATQLNLRPSLVDDLERDHYEQIPIAAYRRGYLRAYARLLGMDEKDIVGQYNAQFGTTEAERPAPTSSPSVRPPGKMGKYLFRLVSLLVIAGLIGLSYVWWQSGDYGRTAPLEQSSDAASDDTADAAPTVNADGSIELSLSQSSSTNEAQPAPDTTGVAAAEDDAATDSAESVDAAAQAASVPAAADSAQAATDSATASDDTAATDDEAGAAVAEAQAADPRKLSLTFRAPSWVQVYDASGRRLAHRVVNEDSLALEGQPPFKITIGKAEVVVLDYMNKPVDLTSHTRGSVAKLTLGE